MIEASITSDSGNRAGAAFAAGTLGYACGYLEAWYSGDPNPALAAAKEAVIGATVGAALGPIVGQLPGQFQLFTGIALAVYAVGSGEDFAVKGLRGTCIVAEFAIGGGFRNLRHVADDFHPPKSLDDWYRSLRRFLGDETGSLPSGPNAPTDLPDSLLVGRGIPEVLRPMAEQLGGRVIDTPLRGKELFDHIFGEMRRADEIFQVMDGIPDTLVPTERGQWARMEKLLIDTLEPLRQKTTRGAKADFGLE